MEFWGAIIGVRLTFLGEHQSSCFLGLELDIVVAQQAENLWINFVNREIELGLELAGSDGLLFCQKFKYFILQHFQYRSLSEISTNYNTFFTEQMPIVRIPKQSFEKMMGEYSFEFLEELGFQYGIQVEKDQEGEDQYYKFQCMNNRPDLLAETSLARAFRVYLEKEIAPKVKLAPPTVSIIVEPSVKEIRGVIVSAVLRNVKFDQSSMRAFLNLQEKLHDTFCRERKYASIGTHDLDTFTPPIFYKAVVPSDIHFVPLFETEEMDGYQMMKALDNHSRLRDYLHLIRDSPVYPVVMDSKGVVGSVPPIINSEHSKLTENTKNILIEITALSHSKAMVCLNTLIWGFSEYCSVPFEVEAVNIVEGEKTVTTPDVSDKHFIIKHKDAEKMVDNKLTSEQILSYLQRSGLQGVTVDADKYQVSVPFWRADILHACDIIEDIAICYGYKNIKPKLPKSATCGSRVHLNKFSDFLRQEMAQAQHNEMLNFALCSIHDMTSLLLNKDQSKLIHIKGAKTKEFQTGRTTLIAGLLQNIRENMASPLPHRLFEAGDCISLDSSTDVGARNHKKLAAILTNEVRENSNTSLFAEAHGTLELILKKSHLRFGSDYEFRPSNRPHYFRGQQFDVLVKGQVIGEIGTVHPEVLERLNWPHPVIAWELDVERLQHFYEKSF